MEKRIPDIARQAIIDKLILIGFVPGVNGTYRSFFERVYPECKEITYNKTTLNCEIGRHCDIFPDDWGDDYCIFSVVDIINWSDEQFLYFCTQYVNPVFSRYKWSEELGERVDLQSKCVEAINLYLKDCGYELRPCNKIGDKIEYELTEVTGVKGTIQGIVFSAVGKPDLVFTDFLNQNVKIPFDNEKYLYYDDKIGSNGLRWGALKDWYDKNLYSIETPFLNRMLKSVRSCGSPIEEKMFNAYLELVEELGNNIPALLPQVYLYYDSKVQKERLVKIFDHQCMDFLMILSESRRIVIELDGIQHYAEDKEITLPNHPHAHIASVDRYASMVSAQRTMTLAGYEVYRFGGKEFYHDTIAKQLIKQFFKDIFEKHGVNI